MLFSFRAAQIEAQKKRDEERKARFAALRAKKSELARKDEPDDGGILWQPFPHSVQLIYENPTKVCIFWFTHVFFFISPLLLLPLV